MNERKHYAFAPIARLADCGLASTEVQPESIEIAAETLFSTSQRGWEDVEGGSVWKRWYRSISGVDKQTSRLVAWKTGAPFDLDHLFFKTVDTNRLLPASLGPFRIRTYATQTFYDQHAPGERTKKYQDITVVRMLNDLVFLRAMHDMGTSDIPILFTNWHGDLAELAMDYWVRVSSGEWTEKQRESRFCAVSNAFPPNTEPNFYQADIFMRAMWSDEEVAYLPPFVIIITHYERLARALFTHPSPMPSASLIATYPKQCDQRNCLGEPECQFFRLDLSKSLVNGSDIVKNHTFSRKEARTICNCWGCEEVPGMRCSTCQEVWYCSPVHQIRDWRVHKRVCEKRD